MNKSLALKNKLILFFSFIISFFIFLYLLFFLINGDRGLISYYKIINQNSIFKKNLSTLINENNALNNNISRLQSNSIDLDFLEEQVIKNTGYINKNEILITFDN